VLIAGDDADAKSQLAAVITATGLNVIDAGPAWTGGSAASPAPPSGLRRPAGAYRRPPEGRLAQAADN
jgi:hypothetical protein